MCACVVNCNIKQTVGATISEQDTSQLKFLYEGHEDFSVIPSFAVIPAQV